MLDGVKKTLGKCRRFVIDLMGLPGQKPVRRDVSEPLHQMQWTYLSSMEKTEAPLGPLVHVTKPCKDKSEDGCQGETFASVPKDTAKPVTSNRHADRSVSSLFAQDEAAAKSEDAVCEEDQRAHASDDVLHAESNKFGMVKLIKDSGARKE